MLLTRLKTKKATIPETAMILAAGKGTRLAPLTDKTPKPLVEVDGKALIDHILDRLAAVGVKNVVVNTFHLGEQIEAHLAERSDVSITFSREEELLETGGGVVKALPLLGDAPFFVINGDSLWVDAMKPTLSRLAEAWDDKKMDGLLLLHPFSRVPGWHGYGDFTMDPEGRLSRREERRVAPYAYMGASILHPRLFEGAPEGAFSLNRLYDKAQEAERLYGALHDGLWYHISTNEDLETARRLYAQGHVPDVPFF
ncbi:nucleotidyltransferase family protein [Nisaea acidiphila]|uniref:Nucleotidyltransferase family protein n=1 Tax=Nisaea acidiphila TaxID=1862145 RepID=A0A9J7AW88_9PROT|nr:nucleotidyltransferase family protein [Nisaea acidiphila]UUX51382.1 nucleotidyltransferase family protein [Nisaea acidiphila]